MFNTSRKFARDILTEDKEGQVFCFARTAILVGGISIIVFAVMQIVADPKTFNLMEYGRTLLEYFGGAAALIFAKGKSGE